MSSDSTEIYYAEMEAARNTACDAYFIARPQADSIDRRTVFKAGFERAFAMLWHGGRAAQETPVVPSPSVLDRLVTVCDACETAACWQGSFMCDSAEMAGIKNLTVRDLHEKPRGENAEYWFKDGDGKIDKTLLEIYQRMTSLNR